MPSSTLRGGFLAVALKIQEAATELSANDTVARLRDAINDCYRGTGMWGYYIDHVGDGTSGDVIYSCDSDTKRAPYEISGAEGAVKCVIDFEQAEDVVPRTVYETEADEEAHYAAMEAALKAESLYNSLPIYERFIGKSEREKASSEDFAGKGKSFPILQPGDIMAAVRSMGRAGSGNLGPSGIKARIIAIAKRKGWEKYLPKAWRGGDAKESQAPEAGGTLKLSESASTLEAIVLRESRADYEIKLIAPGKGSSAFYPAEVLKRDGPKVFKASTHVYLNHPTAAEEQQRPEGDVSNLAGVLTTDAVYHEAHTKGPGLYARMKVFADHAQMVEEKAPHVGMSIRASGVAESGVKRDGVPVLKELVAAESVDVVTRAGAGGMILTEAARPAESQQEGSGMDAAELTKIHEAQAALAETNRKLLERAIRGDAREFALRTLKPVTLHEAAKDLVIDHVMAGEIPQKDGGLDEAKFKEAIDAEAKRVGAMLAAAGTGARPTGMGIAPVQVDATEAARRQADAKELEDRAIQSFMEIGLSESAAKAAVKGQVAA